MSRYASLVQRAVAVGLIDDEGPITPEHEARVAAECYAGGITLDGLCDQLEGMVSEAELLMQNEGTLY